MASNCQDETDGKKALLEAQDTESASTECIIEIHSDKPVLTATSGESISSCLMLIESKDRLQKNRDLIEAIWKLKKEEEKGVKISRTLKPYFISILCKEISTTLRLLRKIKVTHRLGESELSDLYQKKELLEQMLIRYDTEKNDYLLKEDDDTVLLSLEMNQIARLRDIAAHEKCSNISVKYVTKTSVEAESMGCMEWIRRKLHLN